MWPYEISDQAFGLISSFLSKRRLRVVLDGKSSQEYSVNAGVPRDSIFGPSIFLLYIDDLPRNGTELELRVRDSLNTNQFFDPTNQKLGKLPFLTNCIFQNMITLK